MRVIAFASNFISTVARPGDVFGLLVGDALGGNIAHSERYGTTALEGCLRFFAMLTLFYSRTLPRWRSLDYYDYDFRTSALHRCAGPWSYFYIPALGCLSPLTSWGTSTLASARIDLPM